MRAVRIPNKPIPRAIVGILASRNCPLVKIPQRAKSITALLRVNFPYLVEVLRKVMAKAIGPEKMEERRRAVTTLARDFILSSSQASKEKSAISFWLPSLPVTLFLIAPSSSNPTLIRSAFEGIFAGSTCAAIRRKPMVSIP